MKGDRGDGVPNFLSKDDVFVLNGRQKPLRQTKLDAWLDQEPEVFCDDQMLRGWKRNQQLVDLNYIPDIIRKSVMEAYETQAGKGRDKLFNYFIANKLKNLMESINEF